MSDEEKLSREEVARLAELEQTIERAEQDRCQALREVHDQRLYREQYDTFEQYCQKRWGISGSYGMRLIRHVSYQPIGGLETANEAQTRQLERLSPRQAEAVMRKVTQSGAKVTAQAIREARAEVIKVEPPRRYNATPEEKQRRAAEVVRLWDEGYHALDICAEFGISKSTLYADLIHEERPKGQRPIAGQKPRGHPMEVREWRDQPEQAETNVIRLKLVPGKAECDLDRESADRMINKADAGTDHLAQWVKNGYELTESQLERLIMIRDRVNRIVREAAEQKGVG